MDEQITAGLAWRFRDGCMQVTHYERNSADGADLPCAAAIHGQRAFFESGSTLPVAFRTEQLKCLRRAIESNEDDLLEAFRADLGKPLIEAYVSEIGFVGRDIDHALRHLPKWCRAQRRRIPLLAWPGRGCLRPGPYGVALIIGPWNYPFQLLFTPLVGAMAAGNCACLKPSEFAPHTSAVIARLVRDHFPPEYLSVMEGGPETAQNLLRQPFDYIFFTGSSAIGRRVMRAAAERLTPVTLELGGKSPCIVSRDVDPVLAARRILWGKCLNAGQTCVAPDYVLVDAGIRDEFLGALVETLRDFYGESARTSPDFGRIVNERHFRRLMGYLTQGHVYWGGEHDAADLYIGPTILTDVDVHAPVMQEEIFGPILPVLTYSSLDEALAEVNSRPAPMALYLFANDRAVERRVLEGTRSGGVCVNDTVTHILARDLPLGGVGASGMGAYHGKASFGCFSHYRSTLKRSLFLDPSFRYPPSRVSLAILKRVYRFLL